MPVDYLNCRGFEDEFERRELKWWEFLLFKKEVKWFIQMLNLLLESTQKGKKNVDLLRVCM